MQEAVHEGWQEEEAAVREDLLRRRLLDRSPSFLCVIETESMATVRLSPRRSPQVVVTYTRSTGVAPNTNMKNVVFGALGRGVDRGRGWVGEVWRGAGASRRR